MNCNECGQYGSHQHWCSRRNQAVSMPGGQFSFTAPSQPAPSVTVVQVAISADDIERIAMRVAEIVNGSGKDCE